MRKKQVVVAWLDWTKKAAGDTAPQQLGATKPLYMDARREFKYS